MQIILRLKAKGVGQQADIDGFTLLVTSTPASAPEELPGCNFPALQVRDYKFILIISCPVIG